MIQVRQLRKNFGAIPAVRDVSFTAADGCITGLLGKNGAGKTTTLSLTCGLVLPDHGSVRVGSGRVHPTATRTQIGALLDHKGLYDRLTARENIEYFGRLHGMSGRALSERVDVILQELGLRDAADRPAYGFSQGERLKVALARAIVHSPAHLLLDEPTNGLDVPTVQGLRTVLRGMRDEGVCIMFSSHVFEEVRELCDNIVIISGGRVVADGDVEMICRGAGCATLEDAFVAVTTDEETR